jgi:hypothetical protein
VLTLYNYITQKDIIKVTPPLTDLDYSENQMIPEMRSQGLGHINESNSA